MRADALSEAGKTGDANKAQGPGAHECPDETPRKNKTDDDNLKTQIHNHGKMIKMYRY